MGCGSTLAGLERTCTQTSLFCEALSQAEKLLTGSLLGSHLVSPAGDPGP